LYMVVMSAQSPYRKIIIPVLISQNQPLDSLKNSQLLNRWFLSYTCYIIHLKAEEQSFPLVIGFRGS
jgi:hypothetical protein